MGARCDSLGRSTAGHFSSMEAGSELKMNKTGKYEGKGAQIPCARDPLSKGTTDANLDPWVYLSIITYFNSRFQRSRQGISSSPSCAALSCPGTTTRHHRGRTAETPDSSPSTTPLFALTAHSEGPPNFHVHSAQSLSAVISLSPPLSPACR